MDARGLCYGQPKVCLREKSANGLTAYTGVGFCVAVQHLRQC